VLIESIEERQPIVKGKRHAKRQVVHLGGHGKDRKAEPRDTFW
jgi:hypothetical protein